MKTYTKTFEELSNEERKSFLSLSEQDETISALTEGIKNEESVNIEVAYTEGCTAIDYRVFDPYHLYYTDYTYTDGWTNWLLENYDEEEKLIYDVVFQSETASNAKGFSQSLEYCKDYIRRYNGTNESYFADYKGGTVQIVCNETEEVVYEEVVK